jgi:hypothetical protein
LGTCPEADKPIHVEQCNTQQCPIGQWHIGAWSSVSVVFINRDFYSIIFTILNNFILVFRYMWKGRTEPSGLVQFGSEFATKTGR